MDDEPIFEERDLRVIEALEYDPSLTPGYDLLKGCLMWSDEIPKGITPNGYSKLSTLWVARSYLHRGADILEHPFEPEYVKSLWERALAQGIKWPGFKRIELNETDRAFYEEMLNKEHDF